MPRRTYKRPWQPTNQPQGGGIPKSEGPSVDARLTMGAYMAAAVQVYAAAEGISMSCWIRNAVRAQLQDLGTTFEEEEKATVV